MLIPFDAMISYGDPPTATKQAWAPSPAGSLAQARAGSPCLPVFGVLRDAWCRTHGFKARAWRGICVLGLVEAAHFGGSYLALQWAPERSTALIAFAARLFIAPVFVWLMLKGAFRMSGDEMGAVSLLRCYAPRSLLAALLVGVLTCGGLVFCALPGVYVYLTCSMAVMIAAQRKVSPVQAISLSFYGLSGNIRSFLQIQLLCLLGVALGAMPLGIGLIWTLPWAVCVQGEVFRRVFGVSTLDVM